MATGDNTIVAICNNIQKELKHDSFEKSDLPEMISARAKDLLFFVIIVGFN